MRSVLCGGGDFRKLLHMFAFLRHKFRQFKSKRREAKKDRARSPQWRSVKNEHLRAHSKCAGCGSTKHLQVHHVQPFHLHPELELNRLNLLTLCMDIPECHLLIGHGDNFKAFNPRVIADALESFRLPAARPTIHARAKAARLLG